MNWVDFVNYSRLLLGGCRSMLSRLETGLEIHYEPDSIVHHKSSATIGEKFATRHVQVIAERNAY